MRQSETAASGSTMPHGRQPSSSRQSVHSDMFSSKTRKMRQRAAQGKSVKRSTSKVGNPLELFDAERGIITRVLDHNEDRTPLPLQVDAYLYGKGNAGGNMGVARRAQAHHQHGAGSIHSASQMGVSMSLLSLGGGGGAMTSSINGVESSFQQSMSESVPSLRGGDRESISSNHPQARVSVHWGSKGAVRSGNRYLSRNSIDPDSSMTSISAGNLQSESITGLHDSQRFSSQGFGGNAEERSLWRASTPLDATGQVDVSRSTSQRNWGLQSEEVEATAGWTEEARREWWSGPTTITLRETPTIILFSHQDEAVSMDEESEMRRVLNRNAQYWNSCEASRTDEGTLFQEHGVTTLQLPMKSVHAEVVPPSTRPSGAVDVTPWKLHDELLKAHDDDAEEHAEVGAPGEGNGSNDDNSEINDSDEDEESAMNDGDEQSSLSEEASGGAKVSIRKKDMWMLSETLLSTLMIMERAVVQNTHQELQLAYRGVAMDARLHSVWAAPREGRPPTHSAGEKPSEGVAEAPSPPFGGAAAKLEERGQPRSAETATAEGGAVGGWQPLGSGDPTSHGDASAMKQQPTEEIAGPPRQSIEAGNGDARKPAARNGSANSEAASAAVESGDGGGDGARTHAQGDTAADGKVNGNPRDIRLDDSVSIRVSSNVQYLWRFSSRETIGKNVTCMAWNKKDRDILAVGYGEFGVREVSKKYNGMVCCWSLKNPLSPERVIPLNLEGSGVTAMSFSKHQAGLLAIGTTDGAIIAYDIQKNTSIPVLQSSVSTGQHTGTVWAVKWVDRGKGQSEYLMSVSADGRVIEWIVGKNIERVAPDLMRLKRQPAPLSVSDNAGGGGQSAMSTDAASLLGGAGGVDAFNTGLLAVGGDGPTPGGAHGTTKGSKGDAASVDHASVRGEALLSRHSGGMCLDISPSDAATYLVGTEEGTIHQCNRNQTENFEFDYAAHTELVYSIRFSPMTSRYFLTCSADWTARLYRFGRAQPLLKFESTHRDGMQDVAWSPTDATVFATVSSQGHLCVWEVEESLHPFATLSFDDHRSLNCVLFAEQGFGVVVVAGDDHGEVIVVQIAVNDPTCMGPVKQECVEAQLGVSDSAGAEYRRQLLLKAGAHPAIDRGQQGRLGRTRGGPAEGKSRSLSWLRGIPRDANETLASLLHRGGSGSNALDADFGRSGRMSPVNALRKVTDSQPKTFSDENYYSPYSHRPGYPLAQPNVTEQLLYLEEAIERATA